MSRNDAPSTASDLSILARLLCEQIEHLPATVIAPGQAFSQPAGTPGSHDENTASALSE
jgi:hypothetical protein